MSWRLDESQNAGPSQLLRSAMRLVRRTLPSMLHESPVEGACGTDCLLDGHGDRFVSAGTSRCRHDGTRSHTAGVGIQASRDARPDEPLCSKLDGPSIKPGTLSISFGVPIVAKRWGGSAFARFSLPADDREPGIPSILAHPTCGREIWRQPCGQRPSSSKDWANCAPRRHFTCSFSVYGGELARRHDSSVCRYRDIRPRPVKCNRKRVPFVHDPHGKET